MLLKSMVIVINRAHTYVEYNSNSSLLYLQVFTLVGYRMYY
jgi:hypothetical protein